jgi:hypothetical protein
MMTSFSFFIRSNTIGQSSIGGHQGIFDILIPELFAAKSKAVQTPNLLRHEFLELSDGYRGCGYLRPELRRRL